MDPEFSEHESGLDEDEARRLLLAAGATVEVGASAPLPEAPRRRALPALAAAALVAGIIGVGVAWQPDLSGGEQPVATPDATDTATPGASEPPAGSVPSLVGLPVEVAQERLRQAGLEINGSQDYSCVIPDGRVISTEPGAGLLPKSGTVKVVVSGGIAPNVSCGFFVLEEDWGLLDLGAGRPAAAGNRPTFADEVSVVVDGGEPETFDGPDLLDPHAWSRGSALGILGSAMDEMRPPAKAGEAWQTPEVTGRHGIPPATECGVTRPGMSGDLDVTTVSVGFPGEPCPASVDVLRDPQSREIVALFARSARPDLPSAAQEITVPAVRGLRLDEAQELLSATGFAVTTFTWERCQPGTGVTDQGPQAGTKAPSGSTVTITVEREPRGVDCAALDRAADELIAWAQGGRAPALAARVTLMLGYEKADELTGPDRLDPDRWTACVPAGSPTCGNALATLAAYSGRVQRRDLEDDVPTLPDGTPQPDCTADLGGFPTRFYEAWRLTLTPDLSLPCAKQWSIDLFVDDTGALTGVNLSPPR